MHIMVSWDILQANARWGEVNTSLRNALAGVSWVRPLTTTYVVQVSGEAERMRIVEALVAKAREAQVSVPGTTVNILVSPLMPPGQYQGFLPKDSWNEINTRSS